MKTINHDELEWTYDAIVAPDGCPGCGNSIILSEEGICPSCGVEYSIAVEFDDQSIER